MPNDDLLTDEYVAGLLAEEAKDCSLKYSTMGMEPRREPANLPRPNTRFLRNIIKNTETHNKARIAKGEAQSKAKLQELDKADEARRRKTNPDASDIRKRQMGDIHAILGGTKRTGDQGGDDDGGDSDPLNDLIGPAPPARHRGRGTIGGAANLDRRFSELYDPRTDTQDHDMDGGDWDDTVEAYRDLQKLRLNQPQRMRSAGFTENQIERVEDKREKTDKDVVWSKAGEKRAWDRGKFLD
ncbi:pre-mRNA-splicing factor 38B [Hirsutella rhossiliensis]